MKESKRKYTAYYRVSTEMQRDSGLGLLAQKTSVLSFIDKNGILTGEFQDIESGTVDSRDGLIAAVAMCKQTGSTLVVKELSRITRTGLGMIFKLKEMGVEYIESNSPMDPSLLKNIKIVLAAEEVEKLSERTKAALGEIKNKISRGEVHVSKSGNVVTSLGTPENLTDISRARSIESRSAAAISNPNNKKAGALIVALRGAKKSFYSIAGTLNELGFETSRGNKFSEMQTKRLYTRYK